MVLRGPYGMTEIEFRSVACRRHPTVFRVICVQGSILTAALLHQPQAPLFLKQQLWMPQSALPYLWILILICPSHSPRPAQVPVKPTLRLFYVAPTRCSALKATPSSAKSCFHLCVGMNPPLQCSEGSAMPGVESSTQTPCEITLTHPQPFSTLKGPSNLTFLHLKTCPQVLPPLSPQLFHFLQLQPLSCTQPFINPSCSPSGLPASLGPILRESLHTPPSNLLTHLPILLLQPHLCHHGPSPVFCSPFPVSTEPMS